MEVQYCKKCFKNVLPQEVVAFGNNTEKEPQMPRSKLRKYVYYIFTEDIWSVWNPMQVIVFFTKMH